MVNEAMVKAVMDQLGAGAAVDDTEVKDRARQGKLTLRAMIKAQGSGCECEPCRILREGLAVMLGEDPGEVKPGASSLNSPA